MPSCPVTCASLFYLKYMHCFFFLEIIPELLKYYKQCKGTFVVRLGPIRPVVFVADLKMLEFLLTSNKFIEKSIDYRFLGGWLKRGLLTSSGRVFCRREVCRKS